MLTDQAEHARVAGLIASSWNYNGERPVDEALYAVAHHDDAWKAADEQPRINRNGEPMSFTELDAASAIEIWTRNSSLLAEEGKFYAARLVAGHFAWLAEHAVDLARLSPRAAVAIGKFLYDQREAMNRWARDGGAAQDAGNSFSRDLRLLQICDELSLLLCTDFTGEQEITDVPYLENTDRIVVSRKGELTLLMDPFPLKMKVRDHMVSRLIPKTGHESDETLREVISNTKPTTNEIHFRSAS